MESPQSIYRIIEQVGVILAVLLPMIGLIQYLRKKLARIVVKSVRMKSPVLVNGSYRREVLESDKLPLIGMENNLRKMAYQTTPLVTDENFYNDNDMSSEYMLTIVYDKVDNIPLLSARVYWDPKDIEKELKGDHKDNDFKIQNPITKEYETWKPTELAKYEYGDCFIVDRMSGNLNNEYYSNNKNKIFGMLYSEIYKRRKNSEAIYALARRSTNEKLLSNYLRIGLRIIGMTEYYGKEHWVLEGKFRCMKKHFKFIRYLSWKMR